MSRKYITDAGDQRRKLYNDNKNFQIYNFKKNPNPMIQNADSIKYGFDYNTELIEHRDNLKFFIQIWTPTLKTNEKDNNEVNDETVVSENKPKGVIFYIHGYGSTSTFATGLFCQNVCTQNYIVIAMDGYGHGLSDGLHCYIPDFKRYVLDYKEIYEKYAEKYENLKKFVIGISMGGAVTMYLLELDKKKIFSGAILLSPMLKISDNQVPGTFKTYLLRIASSVLPKSKLSFSEDITDDCFNDKELADYMKTNPLFYGDPARLSTAFQLIECCSNVEKLFKVIDHPLLIMHGENDIVTDPKISEKLFNETAAEDKVLKIYPEERHGLMFEESACQCFDDMIDWIEKRNS